MHPGAEPEETLVGLLVNVFRGILGGGLYLLGRDGSVVHEGDDAVAVEDEFAVFQKALSAAGREDCEEDDEEGEGMERANHGR